jgi:adenosine 3'-phospho 5'-phosphosulfate transporter B2
MASLHRQDGAVLGLGLGSAALLYLLGAGAQHLLPDRAGLSWLLGLGLNLLGYATILLPGYLVIQYVRRTGYLDSGPLSLLQPIVRVLVRGRAAEEVVGEEGASLLRGEEDRAAGAKRTAYQEGVQVIICSAGLLGAYSTWGFLQEKIMTTQYEDSLGNRGQFTDSQFLVFVNRILAFAIALLVILLRRQPRHRAPLFKYSYCSLSNILSSWCQYEALKYISFPTQVLAKASKVIPVMLMGKLVSKRKYEYYEYVVAALITVGMVAFLAGSDEGKKASSVTTFSGVVILMGYMVFDSFTSSWQGQLFTEYKMSSIQMMAGVNLFSCLLTSVSLLQQGIFYSSLVFMSQYSRFMVDCIILSICSAIGQLFIYHTISTFGPVIFVIIMTVRQVMAVVISCIKFHHALAPIAILGILIIFSALFLRIYCGYRMKSQKKKPTTAASGNRV